MKHSFSIELQDGAGNTAFFVAGFNENDTFSSTQPSCELETETVSASIADNVISGDQWRDIENFGLASFLWDVFLTGDDFDLYLADIATKH